MTASEKDFMERYIYQVIRRLPRQQRDEVRLELEELISDMFSDRGSMEEVLAELGDPAQFARQYQSGPHYLIGPDYYDTYLWFLKISLICVAAAVFFLSVYSAFRHDPASGSSITAIIFTFFSGLSSGVETAITSCISMFGVITLLFVLFEREKVRIDTKNGKEWSVNELKKDAKKAASRWSPSFLEPVPDRRAVISRGDSIFGIIVLTILAVLVIFAPELFAVSIVENGKLVASVPIFNLAKWNTIMPLFAISLFISLADEILRLLAGYYCRPVMYSGILSSVISIILDTIFLKVMPVWNPNFVEEMNSAMKQTADTDWNFLLRTFDGDMISDILLAIIVVCTLIGLAVTIYKTLRYDVSARR